MRERSRVVRSAPALAAISIAMVLGFSSTAPAKKGPRGKTPAPAPTVVPPSSPIPGGFCAYWGPNYSYTFPDGTVLRCG